MAFLLADRTVEKVFYVDVFTAIFGVALLGLTIVFVGCGIVQIIVSILFHINRTLKIAGTPMANRDVT